MTAVTLAWWHFLRGGTTSQQRADACAQPTDSVSDESFSAMESLLRPLLLTLLLLLGLASGSLLPRMTEDAVADARRELLDTVSALWRSYQGPSSNSRGDPIQQILHGFEMVDDKVAKIGPVQPHASTGTQLLLEGLWPWATALANVQNIENLYETVRAAMREKKNVSDIAEGVVSPQEAPKSIQIALDKLHEVSVKKDEGGLFEGVVRAVAKDSGSKVCALEQSPQQLIYNLYNLVALAELKGYAMMQFSWMILKQYEKGNFTTEAEIMRTKTEKRSEEKAKAARAAMKGASRMVWRCDPKQHEENNTYIQLTELLQGYVQNEVDLNSKSSCGENCGYYTYAKVHGCYHNQYCSKQRNCAGRVFNCQFIDSDSWVCPSDNPTRRYDFIEYENGRVLGRPGHCSKGSTKVDSWWRWLFWHCSYCFCFCDDDGPRSDRFFSLRPAMADTANGFAITGLKFVKTKRVVHLQVQQAKVLPRGAVNVASVEWRPVEAFEVATAAPGRDYHKMDYEQRAIDLDDVTAPPGYVLTGVRFRRIGSHLNTEILATPMDMETGALKPDASLWFGNDNTDAAESDPRTSVELTNPDIPTRSSLLSEPDSVSDQFVTFTHSDMSKDAAQTTVPFLDAQAVAPNPPILLAGAGVYHKGRRGYGGFVALRVITYDFSDYLGANETDTTNLNLVN